MSVTFDHGPNGNPAAFLRPVEIVRADTPDELFAALERLDDARRRGLWSAGYLSYEAGYCFEPRLAPLLPADRAVPLLLFGLFEGPEMPPAPDAGATGTLDLGPPPDEEGYRTAFDRVRDYIGTGDVYQVNLTFPLKGHLSGDVTSVAGTLSRRQPVPHGCCVDLGGPVVLSRSPEQFFRVRPDRTIETRPMKGTVPRGATPDEDARLARWLATSEKNLAENLMIVDLLRNDLSRICTTGSVKVPRLYEIEPYNTVHQMTSTVTGALREGLSLHDIFAALFPCASVTGAPKIRAMEIIRELEPEPRNAYCGSIGWIAPDGAMCFNVAIRTLLVEGTGRVTLNVGGGIVWDSDAGEEYREALLKSAFARNVPPTSPS
ncbi:aminodeoxychorismate synthase, subunit I [Tranquillimonas rosea]|uniref:Aminodeoxychorismate synthase, subunit I n=1 Tax=Tranquillimonas rosea TaxID=641238 RepID=A0A1H9WSG6_9RHOB|nr:aminodeoxychorismate synthase component I [Tranquillimonas rosea]SES36333.1 aminodeoxychorismate synthase, subunit I [Tranquillimonas rosea]